MVHETLRKVASMLDLPEEMVRKERKVAFRGHLSRGARIPFESVDPNRVLEVDLLRWLVLKYDVFHKTAAHYLNKEHFSFAVCLQLFERIMEKGKGDILLLAADMEDSSILDEILKKKVNLERATMHFLETVQKLLDRQWLKKREEIAKQMSSSGENQEQMVELTKRFAQLTRSTVQLISV